MRDPLSPTAYATFRRSCKVAFADDTFIATDRKIRTFMALLDRWTKALGPLTIPGFGTFYRKRSKARPLGFALAPTGPEGIPALNRLAFRASKRLVVRE